MRVALVVMPFFTANCPSLAAGLLKAGLERRAISCDVKYFTLDMVDLLGYETYRELSVAFPSSVLGGEWAFAQAYFGTAHSTWEQYEREVLDHPNWGLDPARRHIVRQAAEVAPLFLDRVLSSTDWAQYDVVGFSSTFEQTLSSMSLARRIRETHPSVLLAGGGANFEGPMGLGLMQRFPFLDYACVGEGDESFPSLCENLARGDESLPAYILRRRGDVIEGELGPGAFVELDTLPTPNYDDFFEQLAPRAGRVPQPWIPAETSRGCWWGQRNHCTFCGLNGDGMAFRSKSWQRVAEEIEELDARHHPESFQFADNILGMPFFKNLLPYWATKAPTTPKFFELKSNLNRSQVQLLDAADIRCVQAGVESLSDRTLNIMKKGVTGAQNVALLRWCREREITTNWNILFGFPGEDPHDLTETLDLVKKMTHLDPPAFCGLIRTDRFSPNFTNWKEHGFESIAPMPAYRHVFGGETSEHWDIAYFFEASHDGLAASLELAPPLVEFCRSWKLAYERGDCGPLQMKRHIRGGFVIIDDRFNFPASARTLTRAESAVVLACDVPLSRESVSTVAQRLAPKAEPSEICGAVETLLRESVIVQIGARIVALATIPDDVRSIFALDAKASSH